MTDLKEIEEAWLNIEDFSDKELFNPMAFLSNEDDDFHFRLIYLMSRPEYFSFLCKHVFNINILPSQALFLCEMWNRRFPMLIASRGFGKSFILSLYSMIRALLMPERKVVVVGAAFRQSKVLFEYMETIWNNAPVLRSMCDANSGPRRDIDRCVMRINKSRVTCLPLGDGQKIRGQRANDIISDEFASIPRETFETVVAGFAAVSSDPIENVKKIAAKKKAKELGLNLAEESSDTFEKKDNQIILSGTAYYDFNHFAEYWKKWKAIIKSKGRKNKLIEIFGEEPPKDFEWKDYSIIRVPYELLPEGFMDASQVARSKATVHAGIYQMEFGACCRFDTPVYTDGGLKNIIDVQVGDMVLTHKGRFRRVTKKTFRQHVGQICKIETNGFNRPVYLTDNHPFWVDKDYFAPPKLIDYTRVVNLSETSNVHQIETENFINDALETLDGQFFYPKSSQSKISLDTQREIRSSVERQSELAKKYGVSQSVISYIQTGSSKPKNSVPRILKLDYDFGCLIGYYAAEGNIGSGGRSVEFALDEHKDTDYQKHLLDCIYSVFGFHGKSYSKKKNTRVININSRLVADIVGKICPGNSHSKLVDHGILFSNESFLRGFVVGYWNGDGHIRSEFASAHCVNQSLLSQVKLALSYFNIGSSLLYGSSETDHKLNISGGDFVSFLLEFYGSTIDDRKDRFVFNDNNATNMRIKSFEKEDFNDFVYNLEVEEDESYSIINATVHNCFTRDSQGFFKRSLIESCVTSDNYGENKREILDAEGNPICFEAVLKGNQKRQYVFGVDPASEVDNFSIVVLELYGDHRRIVHCWTTNREQHKEKVKSGYSKEADFYAYCARKIRDLMKIFPCVHIAMDAQGGGIAVMESLHDRDKLEEGEVAIWPVIDEDKPKDTDDERGLHILEMCQFSSYDWLSEANHSLRKDFEDKSLLFPMFDAVGLGIANAEDGLKGRTYDTLEQCVMEIEDLKDELTMIQITQTNAGRDRWDTPETVIGTGKKGKLRKDRYSALLMANMAARIIARTPTKEAYNFYGGFATVKKPDKDEKLFTGPNWFTEQMKDMY